MQTEAKTGSLNMFKTDDFFKHRPIDWGRITTSPIAHLKESEPRQRNNTSFFHHQNVELEDEECHSYESLEQQMMQNYAGNPN